MSTLRTTLLSFTVLFMLFLTACAPDNSSCTPPVISQNIIGTWTVTGGSGTVEFKSNGTLVDASDDLVGGEINGDVLSVKTYTIANDTLSVMAASPTTTNKLNVDFPIVDNQCNEISISIAGITGKLTRQ